MEKNAEIDGFKGLDGWLNGSLTRHVLKIINLHGEADDLVDAKIARLVVPYREELQ